MTEEDRKLLAKDIANELREAGCPHGIDADTAKALKEFAKTYSDTKSTILRAIIWVVVGGVLVTLASGVIARIKLHLNL